MAQLQFWQLSLKSEEDECELALNLGSSQPSASQALPLRQTPAPAQAHAQPPVPPTTGASALDSLDPHHKDLQAIYNSICKSVLGTAISKHCSFPSNNSCGFSKDNCTHVTGICEIYKIVLTVLHLCLLGAEGSLETVEMIEDITLVTLFTLCRLVNQRDELWLCKATSDDTFHVFQVLEGSALNGECQTHFINVIQMTGGGWKFPATMTSNQPNTSPQCSDSTCSPWRGTRQQQRPCVLPPSSSSSTSSHGTGNSAAQD